MPSCCEEIHFRFKVTNREIVAKKKATVSIPISGKIAFRTEMVTRDEESFFII